MDLKKIKITKQAKICLSLLIAIIMLLFIIIIYNIIVYNIIVCNIIIPAAILYIHCFCHLRFSI